MIKDEEKGGDVSGDQTAAETLVEAPSRAEIHEGVLRCAVEHRLSFDELRGLIAYLWREKPESKCRGLSRVQINNHASAALSKSGHRLVTIALDARGAGEIPEHVETFVTTQLRLLYPGLSEDTSVES